MSDGHSDYVRANRPLPDCTCWNGEPVTSWDPECPRHRVTPAAAKPMEDEQRRQRFEILPDGMNAAEMALGAWMSAALDDPSVCAEMKADINAWFASKQPPAELFPGNRKDYPIFTGLLMYFPNACAAVAHCSLVMNEQHNPGQPMHWAKDKSIGTGDEAVRHLMDAAHGTPPQVVAGREVEHAANAAWRQMEFLERLILKQRG